MLDSTSTDEVFEVQEAGFAGMGDHRFSADRVVGDFVAIVTRTSPTTLNVTACVFFAAFFKGGTVVTSQLNGRPDGYGMYAMFGATCRVNDGGQCDVTSAELHWYIDLEQDAAYSPNGSGAFAIAGIEDDLQIATSKVLKSAVASKDSFELCFADFTLTAMGSRFFVAPVPFPPRVRFSGDHSPMRDEDSFELRGSMRATFPRCRASTA